MKKFRALIYQIVLDHNKNYMHINNVYIMQIPAILKKSDFAFTEAAYVVMTITILLYCTQSTEETMYHTIKDTRMLPGINMESL